MKEIYNQQKMINFVFGVSGVQLKRASWWFKKQNSAGLCSRFCERQKISFPFYELPFHFWWMYSRRCHVNIHRFKGQRQSIQVHTENSRHSTDCRHEYKALLFKTCERLSTANNFEQHNVAVIIRSKLWHKTRELTVKVFCVLVVCDFDTLKWNLVRGLRWGGCWGIASRWKFEIILNVYKDL